MLNRLYGGFYGVVSFRGVSFVASIRLMIMSLILYAYQKNWSLRWMAGNMAYKQNMMKFARSA